MLMLLNNQNQPDFVKTRFLLAGFYCTALLFIYFNSKKMFSRLYGRPLALMAVLYHIVTNLTVSDYEPSA